MDITILLDARTRGILDAMPAPCGVWDADCNPVYCNQKALEFFGTSSLEHFTARFPFLSPEQQPDGRVSREAALENITRTLVIGLHRFEWVHLREGGEAFPCEVTLTRLDQEKTSLVLGCFRDLSELKAKEEELEATRLKSNEADERMRIMFDAMPLCCNFWDKNFNNIDCNEAAAKLFDLSSKQEYLDRFSELSPERQPDGRLSSEKAADYIAQAFNEGYARFEWMHQKLNGDPVPAEITLVRMAWRNGYIVVGYTRDLRELKAKDAELDQERVLLRKVMDSSPVCFVIMVDGAVRFLTPYAESFFGLEIGSRLEDFYPDAEERGHFLNDLGETGAVSWRVVNVRAAHGEFKAMLANAFTTDYYGEPCVMSWFLDVTELREADERVRIMFDAMPLCCNFWDKDFNNIDCNNAAAKLFDLSSKQEYLERFFELSPERQPDGRLSSEKALGFITTAFTEGYVRFEWMHQKLNGDPVPAEITLVRVEWRGEYIVAGYTRDLRELKAKEAELDQERVLLRNVMDSSPVCFVIMVDERVRFLTPYAASFLGLETGSRLEDFYPDAEQRQHFLDDLRETGAVNWRVVSVRAAGDEPREMLANAFAAEYYGEPCVMSWFLDVTEMREKERQLRLARDAAEESTRAKGNFLANMSHEIRTPMNAILGLTHMVLETDLAPEQRSYLEKSENSARALLRILNDILDFSKIEAGKLEMEMVDFSLPEVLENIVALFGEKAHERGLELNVASKEGVPSRLSGDPLRLTQILTNLVGNAIKFTESGGVYLTVGTEERVDGAALLRFAVRDTGIGLSGEQLARLFTAFSQADTSTTRRYGGTGLGLAISRSLAALMQGELWCESEPGNGATFIFTARFAVSRQEESGESRALAPAYSGDPEDLVRHLRGARLLVAEDNEINQLIIRELLEKAGFVVDLANNGREAVDMALSRSYDLIFMDIQMPEMDGFAAVRILRKHPATQDLPIIAMTAHAMVGDKEKSLLTGMDDHVTKPIDTAAVFSVIAQRLEGRKAAIAARSGEAAGPGG